MSAAARHSALLPSFAIVLSAAFWGSMWMPLHAAYGTGLSGAWAAWMVYGVPAFLVLPLILRDGGRGLLAGGWPLLWLGVSTGICNYLYAASVVYGDVARVVLLFYVNPVWSVLLERLMGPATDVIDAAEEVWRFVRTFTRPDAPPLQRGAPRALD